MRPGKAEALCHHDAQFRLWKAGPGRLSGAGGQSRRHDFAGHLLRPEIAGPHRSGARDGRDAYKRSGFDALMIPEGGQKLRALPRCCPPSKCRRASSASLARRNGRIQRSPPRPASLPVAGSQHRPRPSRPSPSAIAAFYGAAPDPRAAIVYDAVTLAVALAQSKQQRLLDRAHDRPIGLCRGHRRLRSHCRARKTERGLAVIEVGGGTSSTSRTRHPQPSPR